jgi:hypothetical protein
MSSNVFISILLCGVARRRMLPVQTIVRSEDGIHSHWRALFEFAQLSRNFEGRRDLEGLKEMQATSNSDTTPLKLDKYTI